MWEILDVLRRAHRGEGRRAIARTTGRSRKTIQRYLTAAAGVFDGHGFHYVREVVSGSNAILEFETELDGIHINGVDMIRWNDEGQIVDFKVMIRPLKAVNLLHQMMGEMLTKISA